MPVSKRTAIILLVIVCWLFLLYYYSEEVWLSACEFPNSQPPLVIEHPTLSLLPQITGLTTPNITNIGFAFIILAHNLKTINTAIVSLQILHAPRNYFVIHVDRKVKEADVKVLTDFIHDTGYTNVKVISTQSIVWGGRELLPAALDGASLALQSWTDWHYMFLVSGDCLPIKPLSEIRKQMVNFWPKNNLAIYTQDVQSWNEVGPSKKFRFKLDAGQKFDNLVKDLEMVYYGTTWVTLTRPFITWVLEATFPRNFLLYITANHLSLDPDTGLPSIFEESYFQTVIHHSPFKSNIGKADECIRFEKWGYCNYKHEDRDVPCMLGDKDYDEMNKTNCLFARKFVYTQLPKFITNQIGAKPKQ